MSKVKEIIVAEEDIAESEELFERLVLEVARGQEPLRIDKFLMTRIEGATRNKIQLGIENEMVLVNDKPVKANYKIKPLDKIVVFDNRNPESNEIIPENISAEVETQADAEKSLLKILRLWGGLTENVQLGEKWSGGMMLLQPADKTLKPKEIPIDDFFHKIVMLRDRLRVLEQNINSNKKLSDEDKVNLQQYITRCYGSLTTFNLLFKNKEQWFVGDKGSKED